MEESKDCNIDIDIDVLFRRMRENIWRRRISFFWRKRKPEEKGENIWKRYLKDIEKSQFRFQSRDFCQFSEGFGISFGDLVSEKKSRFRFWRIWSRKKSPGFGFGKFGLGKKSRFRFRRIWSRKNSLGFGFGKFGIGKKVSVWVLVKILVSSFSGEVDNSWRDTYNGP